MATAKTGGNVDWTEFVSTYLPQIVLLLLVWGPIAVLAANERPIPDPLLDAGFVILGFYFHTVINGIREYRNTHLDV